MEIVFGHPTANFVAPLNLQILHDPLRQRFCRGGVLSSIEFTVDHDMGLERTYILNLSSKLHNPVLQQEPKILGTRLNARSHYKISTNRTLTSTEKPETFSSSLENAVTFLP